MRLRDILSHKGTDVYTTSPEQTLRAAVDRLVNHNCGSLLVTDCGKLVGIITERDILRAVARRDTLLDERLVRDTMTERLITATPDDQVAEVMGLMTEHRIRHLPVLDDGRLVGVVSIGDIVKAQHHDLCMENHYLKNYIQG